VGGGGEDRAAVVLQHLSLSAGMFNVKELVVSPLILHKKGQSFTLYYWRRYVYPNNGERALRSPRGTIWPELR
jgi:hypothetical protein